MFELVTGGSGSGKSVYAEKRICQLQKKNDSQLYYIATMFPYGEETQRKIDRHRVQRAGKGFETLEWYTGLAGKVEKMESGSDVCLKQQDQELGNSGDSLSKNQEVQKYFSEGSVLLECMSNLVANEMYMEEGAKEDTVEAIVQGVKRLKESCTNLVIVTNEVFSESVPDTAEMRLYKKNLGRINSRLAEMADQVTEVIYGIPSYVKSGESAESVEGEKADVSQIVNIQKNIAKWESQEKIERLEKCEESQVAKSEEQRECEFMIGHNQSADDAESKKTEQQNMEIRIVIGGCFQGKEDYARTLYPDVRWEDGSSCVLDQICSCQGVTQFHQFVRRWLQEGRTKEELLGQILEREQAITIISDEIGCGLVPIDAFEREYRETHGRIMTELAARAKRVDRVICGIGTRLV